MWKQLGQAGASHTGEMSMDTNELNAAIVADLARTMPRVHAGCVAVAHAAAEKSSALVIERLSRARNDAQLERDNLTQRLHCAEIALGQAESEVERLKDENTRFRRERGDMFLTRERAEKARAEVTRLRAAIAAHRANVQPETHVDRTLWSTLDGGE